MGSSVQEEGKFYPSHSQTPAGLFLVTSQLSILSGDRRGPQNCLRQSWRLSCLRCRWPPRVGSRPAIQEVKVGRRGVVTPNRNCATVLGWLVPRGRRGCFPKLSGRLRSSSGRCEERHSRVLGGSFPSSFKRLSKRQPQLPTLSHQKFSEEPADQGPLLTGTHLLLCHHVGVPAPSPGVE